MKTLPSSTSRKLKATATLGATALCTATSHAAIVVNHFNVTVLNSSFRFIYDSGTESIQNVGSSGAAMMIDFYQGKSSYFGSWNSPIYNPTSGTLAAGAVIGAGSSWSNPVYPSTNLTDAYYGIRLNQGDGDYNYGWAKFTITPTSALLQSVAFETELNTPILAGATAVPEPSPTLLGLAGGAAAILGIRRRKAA